MMQSNRSYRLLNFISAAILLIALVFMILLSYLLFFDDNPPLVVNSPPTLDRDSYYAGEEMQITLDACRATTSGAVLQPTFINKTTNQLFDAVPVYVDNLPIGCAVSTLQVTVPHFLPPGTYVRRVRARYEVNFLTDRVVEVISEEFEVLPRRE